jgi:hypothetical protein
MDGKRYLDSPEDKPFPLDWERMLMFLWVHFTRPGIYEIEVEVRKKKK